MTIMFNTILEEANFSLKDVRLLRHKDSRSAKGRSPYDLWCKNRQQFELYQSTQSIKNHSRLKASYWAVFLGIPSGETMFVGVYSVTYKGLLDHDTPMPHMDDTDKAGSCDFYDLKLEHIFEDLIGKLFIDWGPGAKAWIQRADQKNKPITNSALNVRWNRESSGEMRQVSTTFTERKAADLGLPQRVKTQISRIIRDTQLSRVLKQLHEYKCQLCSTSLQLSDGSYAEAHHIKPLGKPHEGPDISENIIIVCPNHHVMLDYGAIELKEEHINNDIKAHKISLEFIQYHNNKIYQSSC